MRDMELTGKRLIFRCIFMILIGGCNALQSPLPQNKAVLKGTPNVVINCAYSGAAFALGWTFYPVGSSTQIFISTGNNFYPGANVSYDLQQPSGTNQLNLIIRLADEFMAGTYICAETGYTSASSQLIVLDSNHSSTANASTSTELSQNQTVEMSCTIVYTGNKSLVNANMQWSSGSSSFSSPPVYSYSGNQTTAVSTIYQQTGYFSPFPVYQCNTTFKINTSSPSLPVGAATNQPDYSNVSSPFSSPIQVNYLNPGTIKITGAGDGSVNIGATATCWVDSNPPATYIWYNGSTTTNGPNIKINVAGDYNCTASNKAGSAWKSINVTDGGLSQGAIIAIIVCCVVGGILLIILGIYLLWRFVIRKPKTGSFDDNNH